MRGVDTSLAIKEQVDLYTPRAIADLTVGDFLAFNSEGLSGRQQVIQSPAIRRQAMRSRAFSANGTVDAQGPVEFTASNLVLEKLLPLIFHSKTGNADDPDGSGATYTLVEGGVLTPFTTFIGLDGPEGQFTRRFGGCKVNRATLSARVDAMLTVGLDVAGISKEILDNAPTAVYPTEVEYGYVFSDAAVLFKAGDMTDLVELPVESFDLEINHNLRLDAYRLGSIYRRSLQESITDVTGNFTLDAATKGVNGEALALDGGATHDPAFFERIARDARYAAIRLTVVDLTKEIVPESEPGAGDQIYCSLTFDLPFCRLEEPDFQVRDAGQITGSARFVAYDTIEAKHVALLS